MKTGNETEVGGQRSEAGAPDVCRCQCLDGEACGRKVCTGAYKLERICPVDNHRCDKTACTHFQEVGSCSLETSEPLPPCPFCGSHDVNVEVPCMPDSIWWGRCGKCGVATDTFDTEAEAEAAWRRREAKPEEVSRGGAEGAEMKVLAHGQALKKAVPNG